MPWGRREFALDQSYSEEFLGCFFSSAGFPKHHDWAPGRRVCPLAIAIAGAVLPLGKLGASGDSQLRLMAAPVAPSRRKKLLP
jgi:hypothetical protein